MSVYGEFILKHAPLVLTQIDRDEDSKTYGCCDRNHWHLKIRDFSSAILQQSGLAILMLARMDFSGNIYYGNENVEKWAKATLDYWTTIQLPDGTFDEYYPWEHGFPPTAFSLYTACEIYRRQELEDTRIKKYIRRTADYLCAHIEKDACNQEIASITALYDAYLVLQSEHILNGMEQKLQRILALQNEDGWFAEYGGADIGYLSVSFDMLAEYYWLSKDERVLPSLKRIFTFIKHFIHPDGTAGGEYGSRNTIYLLPNGFEVLAQLGDGEAEAIIRKLYTTCGQYNYFLDSVDDRYLSHYVLHSFCRALEKRINGRSCTPGTLPYEREHFTVFRGSGLISFSKGACCGIISLQKGGIVKLYHNNKEVLIDCGYRIVVKNGVVATTNWQDNSYNINYGDHEYLVCGEFNQIKQKTVSPFTHIPLRVLSFLVGNRIIHFLKKQIILVDNHAPIHFRRTIKFDADKIFIKDVINNHGKREYELKPASNISLRHVASGKFFTTSDLFKPIGHEKYVLKEQLVLHTEVNLIDGSINRYETEKN
ncbi:hypothetical protein [Intestinimonas butyriciproducens]|uniref:hypothetical protein n=1 Tax=Intestinimonas butyriciproducens TaxID=1297617 RepID=UPI0019591A55|nr:hypothetical protein [Intestinimonas butyriciproducens]MBM6974889.1 hypothetical protein [Intestinimonas butyriciproducens]